MDALGANIQKNGCTSGLVAHTYQAFLFFYERALQKHAGSWLVNIEVARPGGRRRLDWLSAVVCVNEAEMVIHRPLLLVREEERGEGVYL